MWCVHTSGRRGLAARIGGEVRHGSRVETIVDDMADRLLRISAEPAPGYLPFVEAHLATLRRDAHRMTGDGSIADEVSSGVLTDVALRWYWFELLRVVLGRSDPAGAFLGVALTRRCARRLREPDEVEGEVDIRPAVRVRPVPVGGTQTAAGWYPEPDLIVLTDQQEDPVRSGTGSRAPVETSVAVRLAKVVVAPLPAPSAALEAIIAWLHAYETYVRYRRIAVATVAVIATLALLELRNYGAAF